MRDILKQFRAFDFILIGLALLLSFTPLVATTFVYNEPQTQESQLDAIFKINGNQVDELPLVSG